MIHERPATEALARRIQEAQLLWKSGREYGISGLTEIQRLAQLAMAERLREIR